MLLKVGLVVIVAVILYVVVQIWLYKREMNKTKEDLLTFVTKNKKDVSATMIENEDVVLDWNGDQKTPLASTVKLMVLLHFVKTVSSGDIKLDEKVALSDIEKFFIDRTDGGAHTYWLEVNDFSEHATLLDVAKGMMQFSSNACTDYLIDLLDLERINDQMKQAGLTEHDELMPLTPMLLWSAYVSDRRRDAYKKMSGVSEEQYKSLMNEIFNIMKNDPKHKKALEEKMKKKNLLSWRIQSLLTQKMTKSTTNEYTHFMKRLHDELLTTEEKSLFSQIVLGETLKKETDQYFWYKGGATLFVFTGALYRKTDTSSISISFFINDPKANHSHWVGEVFNEFILTAAVDQNFRQRLIQAFTK
ncbi:class A beta-lactamase-related serine hydrolase [Bacillus pumilus]|uniref:serine hydrolase n=3 Tax=Bacillaceae TaxID=186817 RepID=UPI00227FE05F|nr:serine hydrolase [Bacillus pumilus]MCY7680357.1 class A beta-lactamase-related serine hydrolase [Bacillus pumilus]